MHAASGFAATIFAIIAIGVLIGLIVGTILFNDVIGYAYTLDAANAKRQEGIIMSETPPATEPPKGAGDSQATGIAIGIALGVAIGAGLGAAMENVGIGVAIGIAIGAGLGGAFSALRDRKG